jgi:hypothetical protein
LIQLPSSNGSFDKRSYLSVGKSKVLSLFALEMDEDNIRVLGTYSRPDLEIELDWQNHGRWSRCWQGLGRNQGPTKLDLCRIQPILFFANGLRGNSRLRAGDHSFPTEIPWTKSLQLQAPSKK